MDWLAKLDSKMIDLPAPIDPVGTEPSAVAADLIQKLSFSRGGDAAASVKLLDARDFAGTVRMLLGAAKSAGELNNLGCAYAALAISTGKPELWVAAAGALRTSSSLVGEDPAERKRAKTNLGIVVIASEGIVVES